MGMMRKLLLLAAIGMMAHVVRRRLARLGRRGRR